MTRKRLKIPEKSPVAAARFRVAATAILAAFALPAALPAEQRADAAPTRIMASEIRVALGDLTRLAAPQTPALHAEGLVDRIEGALGLIPWLMIQAGDPDGAEAVSGWNGRTLSAPAAQAELTALLTALAEKHPLDLAAQIEFSPPGADLAEAAAIHESYCIGCHDGFGDGDPEERYPNRDLRLMAKDEAPEVFLARLINGTKGDESIAFRNPLTDRQLRALWFWYRSAEIPLDD